MEIYLLVVAATAVLGLFVNENTDSSSVKLALLYGGVMAFIGWWQGWPAQLASCGTSLTPILFFVAAKVIGRVAKKSDERFSNLPLIVYFSLNFTPAASFVLKIW